MRDTMRAPVRELHRLAGRYGIQTAYNGVGDMRIQTSAASLLAALRAIGAPLESAGRVHEALREREAELRGRVIEPVCVAWDGAAPELTVKLPRKLADTTVTGTLETEQGQNHEWQWRPSDWPDGDTSDESFISKMLRLPVSLPYGYHDFTLFIGGDEHVCRIIAAPRLTHQPEGTPAERIWGVFLPMYALETARTMGSGDYTAFRELAELTAERGGNIVGTLPLLPVFLDHPYDPGPYSPVSRQLWNEFYVDITAAPELGNCQAARELMASAAFREAVTKARSTKLVDYRRVMGLKRRVMEQMAATLNEARGKRYEESQAFLHHNPHAADYARFRAVMEGRRETWSAWPERLRDGDIREGDYDRDAADYHAYAQWLAHEQVGNLRARAKEREVEMYFDLPLGVHGAGYDVWRHRELFSLKAATGAPPDAVFTSGQNWGFPPLLPEALRQDGYRYVSAYLRHHMQQAGVLRIDHVMGLHRLFWIPQEMRAADGVYVRYPAEELYAVIALESQRHRCIVVGEDLGIVPGYVRRAMSRHGMYRMSLLHYEMLDNGGRTLGRIPRRMVSGMNNHDMPPFAKFWSGADIGQRQSLGLVGEAMADEERRTRPKLRETLRRFLFKNGFIAKAKAGVKEVMKGCLCYLASSRANMLLVNLEDLWLETESQNIPGTVDEHPNWRRKARKRLEDMADDGETADILQGINTRRKETRR